MPMGKRIPQMEAWRNMCIQRIASMGALAISSEISSGWSWASTTAGRERSRERRRGRGRPRPRPICQLIGEKGGSTSIRVTTGPRLLRKAQLSRVSRATADAQLTRPDSSGAGYKQHHRVRDDLDQHSQSPKYYLTFLYSHST